MINFPQLLYKTHLQADSCGGDNGTGTSSDNLITFEDFGDVSNYSPPPLPAYIYINI